MTVLRMNAQLRARSSFAKLFQNLWFLEPRQPALPKNLNDKIARDIGLEPHQLAQLRFEWPSQRRHDI